MPPPHLQFSISSKLALDKGQRILTVDPAIRLVGGGVVTSAAVSDDPISTRNHSGLGTGDDYLRISRIAIGSNASSESAARETGRARRELRKTHQHTTHWSADMTLSLTYSLGIAAPVSEHRLLSR